MVAKATRFCARSFVRKQSMKKISSGAEHMCSLSYPGLRDFLFIDQYKAYSLKEIRELVAVHVVQLAEAHIETFWTTKAMEMHHTSSWLAYKKIKAELITKTSDQESFDVAVLTINCTVGLVELCITLLVSEAISRLARRTPASTQFRTAFLI